MESPSQTSQDGVVKRSPFDALSRDELIQKCKGLLSIAQKAKQAKNELQAEYDSYKHQLEKCENEKLTALKNVQTLQELVDSLTEQKLAYITEADKSQGIIKALNNKCKSYEEEIADLDIEVKSLKRQNNLLLDEKVQLQTDLERQTVEINNIGLEQQKHLQLLEKEVLSVESNKTQIDTLNSKIGELELQLKSNNNSDYENKIKELTTLYETEKTQKEKVNTKLKTYKDKILKCAANISQLKNSRFILTKTIKEYSENIPKWQNDINKASKILDDQIIELHSENTALKTRCEKLEQMLNNSDEPEKINEIMDEYKLLQSQLNDVQQDLSESLDENASLKVRVNELNSSFELEKEKNNSLQSRSQELNDNNILLNQQIIDDKEHLSKMEDKQNVLKKELEALKNIYKELNEVNLPLQIDANNKLNSELDDTRKKFDKLYQEKIELLNIVDQLKSDNEILTKSIPDPYHMNAVVENISLQLKALESEKAILVKEKLNARENVIDLENRNKMLSDQNEKLIIDFNSITANLKSITMEKNVTEKKIQEENKSEINKLQSEIVTLQKQLDLLKKEYENLQDLNGLLIEEVETLKISLEQPRPDDAENFSDLNVSLQSDIVKLETKLTAYKQENSSLLQEVKESRAKVKEFDHLAAECEDAKVKLLSYKTENTELLNEMREINQVLKERGESISKLQKAISEMERLVETLEIDRNNAYQKKAELENKVTGLENELKNVERNANEDKIQKEILFDKEESLKHLAEKDNIIMHLKEEIGKMKQQQSIAVDLPNEDMSSSTISKAEEHSRMKDLDETFEEKYTKLRIFALKLKKKLNETVSQLKNAEEDKTKLEKLLNENEKSSVPPPCTDEVDSCKVTEISDLQNKIKTLNESVVASNHLTEEILKLKAEIESKSQLLASEIEGHKATKEQLEKARRDAKKKNVLSLEMEDYERSMKELTTKMEEKKMKLTQMESTIDTQEGTITAMKTQIKLLEEQIKIEETNNRLVKEELQRAMVEVNEKDNVIQSKNALISKLEQDLEDEKRKNEEADLEMTSILSDKEKQIIGLSEDKIELNSKVKKLEFKCGELAETLKITNIELADLKTEYTSYKVRAQAVLRQNQTVDHSQEEQLKEETAALRSQIETLTAKLVSAQEQCAEVNSEVEALRRRAAEAGGEAARAQQRTSRLQADLAKLSHEFDSEKSQHKLQVSTLTQCYKTQITELETRLQKETEILRKQLSAAQEVAATGPTGLDLVNRNQYMLAVIPKDDSSDGEMDINVSMIPREEGEGSESAPSPPPSKPYMSSGRSPVPLERLLEEGVPDDEDPDSASLALNPEQENLELRRRLQAQMQRVKHVTVLLSESERECARMAQLSELLKAELRRARGSTQSAHNAEYMKNVTLKFLTLPPGDERSRLVPVLQKILTLTPDETNKVHAVAKGLDPNPKQGWGSYLPWPGGK